MYDGKKNTAYTIFYSALETVKSKLPNEEKTALEIWKAALENITPQVEIQSRRVCGATLHVPTEIHPDRKESIAMKNPNIFSQQKSWTHSTSRVAHSNVRKTCTVWLRPTVLSHILDFNLNK